MSEVKVAFDTPVVPGDTVAWFSRRYGWKQGKVRRTRIEASEGYKYDYSVTPYKSVPYTRYKTTVSVASARGYGVTTFSRPQNLLKISAFGGTEIKV
jgi:hypothetical protein